ncbi:MAG: Rieske 2Fe-2S domain-containing protein [Rhodospirillaceae bacterium]|nr:Rieske 2Fe-2S domain-containing protein [Rhodospirillaceae bacterium]MYB12624.1 Rieske 2Fe-2S domain-containing protein [Rhodospirillaceae bacterium]MYI50439.1 Rieske 2Fe-2S domain-containing protein [Rhodospirillaceae bacterium]
METETHKSLIRRVFSHLDAGTTDRAPDILRNPVGIYTDPGRLEAEMVRILRRKTLLAGLSGRLPGPGSFLAEDLAGVPVLLMRGEDGVARAFLNSCRHRGTRLLDGAGAVRRAFACPYHGWTYGVDGRLTGVPDQEAFEGADLADCSLAALPCTETDGMIWIRLSGDAPADAGESLDGLAAEFAGYELAGYHHYASHRMTPAINWKMALDTFMEPYHFAVLHKETVAPIFFPNLCLYDEFGESFREYLPRRSIVEMRGRPEAEWDAVWHSAIVYYLPPNAVFVMQQDHAEVWRIFPRDGRVDWTEVHLDLYIPEPAETEKARRHWDANLDLAVRTVENEDFAAAESAYAGFASGLAEEVVYGRNEPALQGLHRRIAAMMAGQ